MINKSFPDSSRIWIFALKDRLTAQQSSSLLVSLQEYCGRWKAHGATLGADVVVLEDQFIVLTTSKDGEQASGCSIDEMTRVVHDLCTKLGAKIVDPGEVLFEKERAFLATSRPVFKQLFATGELTSESRVIDTTIQTLKDLRAGKLMPRLADSWHAKLVGPC